MNRDNNNSNEADEIQRLSKSLQELNRSISSLKKMVKYLVDENRKSIVESEAEELSEIDQDEFEKLKPKRILH